MAHAHANNDSNLPEVVPDSSPEAGQAPLYMQHDKYPAYYDTAPKLPHEPPMYPPPGPYQQQWAGAGDPASAVSPSSAVPWQPLSPGADDRTYVGSEPEPERRICGLKKRICIIVAIVLAVVVIAAAVGGGVGGALASRDSSERSNAGSDEAGQGDASSSSSSSSSTTSSSASSPTPPPTSTSSVTTSTSTTSTSSAPSPTVTWLHNQTDFTMGFGFQGWEKANFTGEHTQIYTEEGFFDLPVDVISYMWVRNETDCCITFCEDKKTSNGYRCEPRKRIEAEGAFSRIHIWCGGWDLETVEKNNEKCS